jgi:hypothetical protein
LPGFEPPAPQTTWLLGQLQFPPEHVAPIAQGWLHPPQFMGSVCVSTQLPPQIMPVQPELVVVVVVVVVVVADVADVVMPPAPPVLPVVELLLVVPVVPVVVLPSVVVLDVVVVVVPTPPLPPEDERPDVGNPQAPVQATAHPSTTRIVRAVLMPPSSHGGAQKWTVGRGARGSGHGAPEERRYVLA